MSPADCSGCQIVSLVVTKETGIRLLMIQCLSERDLFIEYAGDTSMPQLRDCLLQMDHWLAYQCVVSCAIYNEFQVAKQRAYKWALLEEDAEYIADLSRVPLAHTNKVCWTQFDNLTA